MNLPYLAAGAVGVSLLASWILSARSALATMFVFTAVPLCSDEKGSYRNGAAQPASAGTFLSLDQLNGCEECTDPRLDCSGTFGSPESPGRKRSCRPASLRLSAT